MRSIHSLSNRLPSLHAVILLTLSTAAGAQTAPVISAISPSPIAASSSTQTLTVTGSGFLPGLTVRVTSPTGQATTYSGNQVLSVTATSFQVVVSAPTAGSWSVAVTNPAQTSNAFAANVIAPPVVSSVSPASVTASSSPVAVTITGSNFQPGANVAITSPTGTVRTLTSSTVAPGTSVAASATFDVAGTWSVSVVNPDGSASTKVPVSVATVGSLALSNIFPSYPIVSSSATTLTLAGANFVPGLILTLTAPNGNVTTVAPSQITGLTATSLQAAVVLNAQGEWRALIRNPDGATVSRAFGVVSPVVQINSVFPPRPLTSSSPMTIWVSGGGFTPVIAVEVNNGSGSITTLTFGSGISSVTPTAFQMSYQFAKTGSGATITVRNPTTGGMATYNWGSVNTGLTNPGPVLSSVSGTLTATAGPQYLTVNGSNFLNTPLLVATTPDGITMPVNFSLMGLSAVSFSVYMPLNMAGTWFFAVVNPDGRASGALPVNVASPH